MGKRISTYLIAVEWLNMGESISTCLIAVEWLNMEERISTCLIAMECQAALLGDLNVSRHISVFCPLFRVTN